MTPRVMRWRQLRLLLWKSVYLYRLRRNWAITALEVLTPLLLTVVQNYLRCNGYNVGDTPLPIPTIGTTFAGSDNDAPSVIRPSINFPSSLGFVPAPGKVTGEEVLRQAFPSVRLESFPSEAEMVAKLSVRTNAVGLANNYGVVFERVEQGELSYTLRFPSWQEFYTRQTFVGNAQKQPPFWMNGILLPMVSGLNLAVARSEAMRLNNPLPPVYFQTRRFPAPKAKGWGGGARRIADLCVVYGFIVIAPVAVKRIADEKSVGMKELLHIAGVSDAVYWLSAYLSGLLVMAVVAVLMTTLMKLPLFCAPALLPQSDFTLVLAMIMLYAVYCDLFCLLISCVVKTPVYAVFATVCLWTLTYEVPVFFMDVPESVEYEDLSLIQKIQSSIFPNMVAHWIFRIISLHEENNDGAHWSNFRVPGSPYDNVTLFGMTLVVCCYCVVYGMFVWYLHNVWPWQYGIPKDPLFFIKRSYWFYSRRKQVTISESTTDSAEPDAPIEGVGDRTNPGIVLNDVTKVYHNQTVAVRHVSLKAYPGDVTVLLGRNGAGKTTLLRLITGLEQATEGCVYVAGFDVALETDSARRSMGFCPQENVLFLGLTVLEHLQFFARIRSDSWATGDKAIEEILEAFNLAEKRDALACSLSWGTMRKLQLGVAIVGSPLIVVLDEPTAGADPECKGALWECVLRFHEDKTMLLTTHSMEEADTLGDRIAVLASGRLRCCGSPLFLRTTYGTGYWIRAGMKNFSPARALADLVRRYIPRAHIKADDHQTLNANVGDPGVKTLIQLLRELEENRHTYLLDSVSVFVAALEDVLRCVDRDPGGSEEEGMPDCPCALVDANKAAAGGINPSGQQRLYALVVKRLQYGRRDFRLPMLTLLLLLSVIFLFVFMNQKHISRKLIYFGAVEYSLRKIFSRTVAFYTADESTNNLGAGRYARYLSDDEGAEVRRLKYDEPWEWLQDQALENYQRYRRSFVVGAGYRLTTNWSTVPAQAIVRVPSASLREKQPVIEVTAWHSAYSPHSAVVSLTAATQAFLPGWKVRVVNHPLPKEHPSPEPDPMIVLATRIMCGVFIPVGLAFLAATYVLFPIQEANGFGRARRAPPQELVQNVKLCQLLAGAGALPFWVSSFIVDLALHAVCSLVLLLPLALLDWHRLYSDTYTLASVYTIMLSYGWASIPVAYVASLVCDQPSTGYVAVASVSIVAGIVLKTSMSLLYVLPQLTGHWENITQETPYLDGALWIFRTIPSFALTWGISNCLQIAQERVMCRYMSTFDRLVFCQNFGLESIPNHLNRFIECCPEKCRECALAKGCLTWEKMSGGREVLLMLLVGIALLAFVTALDSGPGYVARTRRRSRVAPPAEHLGVIEERTHVRKLIADGRVEQAALLVSNLSKSYGTMKAVHGLSFALRRHECFGLLGMNGAGKTTTFRMLTGDLTPTAGNAFIGDTDLVTKRNKYQARIGYCPQADVALDLLTGREMLALFARLRGIREQSVPDVIHQTLEFVDMAVYADFTVGTGGTRRKLSLAVAFVGNPNVVLLDEPTAAVDPPARRRIWRILIAAKQHLELAILLSSHCMRECEALCSRVGILSDGRFACLGSTQQLKESIGHGATVLARSASPDPRPLLEAMESRFPGCHLRRRQAGALLRFHVPARPWHELFIGMKELRAEELIHEYLVSDVSLTEVFRHFTKHKQTPAPIPASTPAISPALAPAHTPPSSKCPSPAQV
ncbi:phospholipid-transporting ATPase ABCA3-like [Rhipicephalus microplus]|uniref:phospholipid-transporting ATPase ABCA3-like n=1 Tax=Rhipicephalus microplus TaxID=6941 RepID=UPI003F6BDA93